VENRIAARLGSPPSKRFYRHLYFFSIVKTAFAIALLVLGIRVWSR
jgi:hypothetical protein